MKTMTIHLQRTDRFNLIARFGGAKLITKPDGRMELRGGSRADLTEAKEWISLFMHEAVPRIVPPN